MPTTPVTLRDLLLGITETLPATVNPDDSSVLRALSLAAHAATATAEGPASQDWAFYTDAIQHAVRILKADHTHTESAVHHAPTAGPDSIELRQATIGLVKHLADLYATAAADAIGPGQRRNVWSRVAHYLDDAAAELA
ncbi:hypothetical protein ABT369_26500 [Dactylosporangium sp. NPDC000244]|uniref:hypothetical protein n=1 Tax=Dactylosporangium sp. NPDC000244 TaxID=3154365 RepID=UPI0033207FAB